MTKSESPLLAGRRWGVGLGTALILMLLAGAGGAVAWGFYGNEVLTRLGFDRERATAPLASAPTSVPDLSAMIGLLKDLQASDQRMAEQLEAALKLLTAEQNSSIATAAALAALGAKVDLGSPQVLAKNSNRRNFRVLQQYLQETDLIPHFFQPS